jgi:hypothetical protein
MTLGITVSSPVLLGKISRIYQYGYWFSNMGYAGLGTDSMVHRFRKGSRIFCLREAYSPKFEEVLLNLQSHLEREGRLLQRHPHSRATYLLEIEGKEYVVKESFKKPRIYCLLFPSRYSRLAWNNAEFASSLGFEVFHPVALVEFGECLSFSSYILYPFVGTTLAENKCVKDWLLKLEEAILQQKRLRLIHPDFRPTNVVLLEGGAIQYIDIDEMHRYPPYSYLFHARFKKEIRRFESIMQEEGSNFSFGAL